MATRAFAARNGIVLILICEPRGGLTVTAFAENIFFVTQEFVMARRVRLMARAALAVEQRFVDTRLCDVPREIVMAFETGGLLIDGWQVLRRDDCKAYAERGGEQEGKKFSYHRLSPSCAGTWQDAQSPDSKGACCFARMR